MRHLHIYLILIIAIQSCLATSEFDDSISESHILSKESSTIDNTNSNFVTQEDVQHYVKFKILEAKDKGKHLSLESIIPKYSKNGKLTMYVIHYNTGWDIISSDKRLPVLIATSEKGTFNYLEGSPQLEYLNLESEKIEVMEKFCDSQYSLTKSESEECYHNLAFWAAITANTSLTEGSITYAKEFPELTPEGRWVLTGVTSKPVLYDSVPHLTSTRWNQWAPYNIFCPRCPDSLYNTPAGCVAIAASQIVYYLYEKCNHTPTVPTEVPTIGNPSGGSSYPNGFSNFRSDCWNTMNSNSDYRAAFISYIGFLSETDYSYDGSYAHVTRLEDNVFNHLGISCTCQSYDAEIIKDNLIQGLPVLASASDADSGHAFIIDGYKRYQTEYTYTYEWIYDAPTEDMIEIKKPIYEYEYSTPYIEQIQMNWGWSRNYPTANTDNYNVWFCPTENWIVNWSESGELTTQNYFNKNHIIYGFSIM